MSFNPVSKNTIDTTETMPNTIKASGKILDAKLPLKRTHLNQTPVTPKTGGADLVPVAHSISLAQGLDGYIRAVNAIPALSAEREHDLAVAYYEENNLNAARELVLSQLSYVVYTAKKFQGYGLPISDLIQEGNIGLMKAVKHFDPYRKVRFITFAVHWIRAEIYEFVVRNWRIVKIATTKAQRKLFFGLRKSRNRLGVMSRREIEKTASELNVPVKDVALMDQRFNSADMSFDPMGTTEDNSSEDDHRPSVPAEYLSNDDADPATLVEREDTATARREALHKILSRLDERSATILRSRWLNSANNKKTTLQSLAQRFNISIERVRQIEKSAMTQVRDYLQECMLA